MRRTTGNARSSRVSAFSALWIVLALAVSACGPGSRAATAGQAYPTLTPEAAATNTAIASPTTEPSAATAAPTSTAASAAATNTDTPTLNPTNTTVPVTSAAPTASATTAAPALAATAPPAGSAAISTASADNGTTSACTIKSIDPITSGAPTANNVMQVTSRRDSKGVYQIYVANQDGSNERCLSCGGKNAPPNGSFKVMPTLDPSHTWIVTAVEEEQQRFQPNGQQPQGRAMTALLNGFFADLYAVNVRTGDWTRLTTYQGTARVFGVLGPHFTPDGHTLVWSKIVGGPDRTHEYGYYRLFQASFTVNSSGVPSLAGAEDFTPSKGTWFEPNSFSPDGSKFLFSADLNSPQTGQDLWIMDWPSRQNLKDLTNSPNTWDEHGAFSPHGTKIAWMSSKPYPTNGPPTAANVRTELFIMNADGSDIQQITHFNQAGYRESSSQRSVAGTPHWSADGTKLQIGQLHTGAQYPNITGWIVSFSGPCG